MIDDGTDTLTDDRLRDHGDDRGAFGLAEIGPAEPDEQRIDAELHSTARVGA